MVMLLLRSSRVLYVQTCQRWRLVALNVKNVRAVRAFEICLYFCSLMRVQVMTANFAVRLHQVRMRVKKQKVRALASLENKEF